MNTMFYVTGALVWSTVFCCFGAIVGNILADLSVDVWFALRCVRAARRSSRVPPPRECVPLFFAITWHAFAKFHSRECYIDTVDGERVYYWPWGTHKKRIPG